MSKKQTDYQRPQGPVLAARLAEPRRFVQVVAGPRQVGKSTLVQQVTAELGLPLRYVSADEPTLRGGRVPIPVRPPLPPPSRCTARCW